jgi:hypothetical protein
MKVALLRVGIDTGSGGIHGPLFRDGTFEFIPIPDPKGRDERTYGDTAGKHGRLLTEYFPPTRRIKMAAQPMHVDPEWETFTYGDPSPPKAGLRRLERGDLLVFYGGLQGWDHESAPALYLLGYFKVEIAGIAAELGDSLVFEKFAANFHVRHKVVYQRQRSRLVLVKGGYGSRLLKKAVCISAVGRTKDGKPLKILSPDMQSIFGDFDGKLSFQRSPTRWVKPDYIDRAAEFVGSLK